MEASAAPAAAAASAADARARRARRAKAATAAARAACAGAVRILQVDELAVVAHGTHVRVAVVDVGVGEILVVEIDKNVVEVQVKRRKSVAVTGDEREVCVDRAVEEDALVLFFERHGRVR